MLDIIFVSSFFFAADIQFKLKKDAVSHVPDNLIIPDLDSVVIDNEGNTFAFAGKDNGNTCFILKFDKNLKYIKHFGRDGRGPSEFTTNLSSPINRLSLNDNGDIYIVDFNPLKLVVYDNNGNYKQDIMILKNYANLVGNLFRVMAFGKGHFCGLKFNWNSPVEALIFKFSPEQVKLKYSYESQMIQVGPSQYEDWSYGGITILDADVNHMVIGESQIYKFMVYNSDGKKILEVFDENRVMKSFNEKEFEFIKNTFKPNPENTALQNSINQQLMENPSLLNAILKKIKNSKNVIADIKISGNWIYVFLVNEDITEKKYPLEIFDLKGKIVRKGYLDKIPVKIHGKYFYFIERPDEDNPYIERYKLMD